MFGLFDACCGDTGVAKESSVNEPSLVSQNLRPEDVEEVQQRVAATAVEDAQVQDIQVKDFELKIHSATLNRSFAKVGWMDPYAVITADGKEASRTKAVSHGHKTPKWEMSHHFSSGTLPSSLVIAVYDKNHFHKDVLCGCVTIPCSPDMGAMTDMEWTLTKKGAPTGTLRVSLTAREGTGEVPDVAKARQNMARTKTLGGEFDQIVAFGHGADVGCAVTMREQDHPDAPAGDEAEGVPMQSIKTIPGGKAAPLMGSWRCIDTHGLEDFLKAAGVGLFQRKLALGASWPSWDFSNEGTHVLFVNHSAIGDLKENFVLGKDYQWKDGHGNEFTCHAEWIKAEDGGTLKVTRKGKVGEYIEERTVKDDTLEFVLTHITYKVSWGRKFQRV